VLYPIRSVWGRYVASAEPPLPGGQPSEIRAVMGGWTDACRTLLSRQVDFDCLDERALVEGAIEGGALHAGEEAYAVIVIPPADRLSDRSLDALRRFAETGGRLVVVRDPALTAPPVGGPGWPGALTVSGNAGLGELVGTVIRPTVHLDEPCPHLLCSRHLVPGGTCVFVINNAPQGVEVVLRFDDDGPCRVWDPATGDISDARPCRRGEPLALSFGPFSGWFVVFSGT
jgi:hypothetical protein